MKRNNISNFDKFFLCHNIKRINQYCQNDIKINAAKAVTDKETQKLVTFNDLQTQFGNLKKQLTTSVKSKDNYGRDITTPGLKPDSIEYLTTIGNNLMALVIFRS